MSNPTAETILAIAEYPVEEKRESYRIAHEILDSATTLEQLKPVLELMLLKLYERR